MRCGRWKQRGEGKCTRVAVVLFAGDDKGRIFRELVDVGGVVAGCVGYGVEGLEEADDVLVEREGGRLE